MVAYSFKYRFVEPIRLGAKSHTIRGDRKRHAHPGERVQLYYGMRTQSCKLIGTATCYDVRPITIDFDNLAVWINGQIFATSRQARDQFAVSDGFINWTDLVEFWRAERSERTRRNTAPLGTFDGVIIRWGVFVDYWKAAA